MEFILACYSTTRRAKCMFKHHGEKDLWSGHIVHRDLVLSTYISCGSATFLLMSVVFSGQRCTRLGWTICPVLHPPLEMPVGNMKKSRIPAKVRERSADIFVLSLIYITPSRSLWAYVRFFEAGPAIVKRSSWQWVVTMRVWNLNFLDTLLQTSPKPLPAYRNGNQVRSPLSNHQWLQQAFHRDLLPWSQKAGISMFWTRREGLVSGGDGEGIVFRRGLGPELTSQKEVMNTRRCGLTISRFRSSCVVTSPS